MSRPRQILPGQFYLINRRCTQRQFLLRPDAITNNAFIYCLAEAARRFDIDIILTVAESNHHHTIVYDRHGRVPQFLEHFHKMLARCMNARWQRWENLWAAQEPCVTRLLDRDTVIAKLVYVASNPVKDLLVERATQWPGPNGYRHFISGTSMDARRPQHFFRPDGGMPEEVTLALVIPPELVAADTVIAEVKAGVAEVERAMREHRATTGARVVGRRAILEQRWHASPTSPVPRRNMRPRFAGPKALRIKAIEAFRDFLAAYRVARRDWLAGVPTVFPRGTYWLARFAPVEIAAPIT